MCVVKSSGNAIVKFFAVLCRSGFCILLPGFLLIGCEEVVEIELSNGVTRLVVEGGVEGRSGPDAGRQRVVLSTTAPFASRGESAPKIPDAQVRVSSSAGDNVTFNYKGDGLYETTELIGVVGVEYTLHIQWQGDEYEARETMAPVARIDSIYYEFQEETAFEDEGLFVKLDASDPPGLGNYYMWKLFVNGEWKIKPDPGNAFDVIASDEFFDGRLIQGFLPNEEFTVEPGDSVRVEQHGLTVSAYEYYFAIYSQNGNGTPFDPPPANVRGNVRNLSTAAEYAVGYFTATEVAEASIVVK